MAREHRRYPQRRALVLAVTALILTTVLLVYMRLDPRSTTMSSPGGLGEAMAASTTTKHGKGHKKGTYPHISTLPDFLLPTAPDGPADVSRRLIIIGDVHGHLRPLETLLRKVEFSAERGDTVVFTGDMVNKGPDSAGVVELAMRIGAFSVRGNHEDNVLRAWERYESKKRLRGAEVDSDSVFSSETEEEVDGADGVLDGNGGGTGNTETSQENPLEESDGIESNSGSIEAQSEDEKDRPDADSASTSHKKKKGKGKKDKKNGKGKKKKAKEKKPKPRKHKPNRGDLATAKSLGSEHRAWLAVRPLILRIGHLGPRYGEVVVVHAGLVPGVSLESQDPEAVMTMRTLLLPERTSASASDAETPNSQTPNNQTPNNQTPLTTADQSQNAAERPGGHKEHRHTVPSASRDGIPWAEIWTSYQKAALQQSSDASRRGGAAAAPTTVVYGHDAKAGLQMRRYALGLDTGCGNHDALTALVFELASPSRGGVRGNDYGDDDDDDDYDDDDYDYEGEEEEEVVEVEEGGREGKEHAAGDSPVNQQRSSRARIRHRLVSVPCSDARSKD
ncbi:Metallo-dependent phosphatase [Xylaria palmicola]|nr:Metallo-dependent phosphatase [Xylaria palmicola]